MIKNTNISINWCKDFFIELIKKELIIQYKHTRFGFFWAIISPLIQMIVIGTIFSFFIKTPNYYLILLTALLPWNFFSSSVSASPQAFLNNRNLIKKARLPYLLIPLSKLTANFIQLIINFLILLFIIFLSELKIQPHNLIFLGISLLWLFILSSSLSIFLSTANIFSRDVDFIIKQLMQIIFYASPIVYQIKHIPSKIISLFYLNPLTSIISLIRMSLLNQSLVSNTIILGNTIVTLLIIITSLIIYLKKKDYIVDKI